MTNTKLEIIGPYTPEHPGPFCTRSGTAVKIITKTEGSEDFPIVGLLHGASGPSCWHKTGSFFATCDENYKDLMNAREVPVAREFWVNEYVSTATVTYHDLESAKRGSYYNDFLRTIHVREVLPGDEG